MVDASYYPSDLRIPGIEDDDTAYDALNSALAVNFNTIYAERIGNKVRLRGGAELRSPRSRSPGSARRAPRTETAASVLASTLSSVSDTPAN